MGLKIDVVTLPDLSGLKGEKGDKGDPGDSGGTALPGTILMYGGASAPTGFLLCDGSAVSRVTYAALFAIISTNFGPGDGTTTFNVPDLRGRVGIGMGQGSGLTNRVIGAVGGEQAHILVKEEIPTIVWVDINAGSPIGAGSYYIGKNTTGGGAHNNMQPYTVINYIIKT